LGELNREDTLWLLSMLPELSNDGWLSLENLFQLCRTILLDSAPKWIYGNPPDFILLESVVTLAATLNWSARRRVITNSLEHPWLLLNIRNPALFSEWFGGVSSMYHEEFISMGFLVIYALIRIP